MLKNNIQNILKPIGGLLSSADIGRILSGGVETVILGLPNVGKSTLLNSLLGEDRAIVTKHPGTTRDSIIESTEIDGIEFRLHDTAGLRKTKCVIEEAGILRAREHADRAELILFVLDGSRALSSAERVLIGRLGVRHAILVLNKIDLGNRGARAVKKAYRLPMVETALSVGRGLSALKRRMTSLVVNQKTISSSDPIIINSRHREALLRAKGGLLKALNSIKIKMPADFIVIDLRSAAEALGEITGKAVSDQVIDKIFDEFCVGK